MLILKRKREQQIAIGPDIVVKVVGIHDGIVILGITAPATYKINREEPPQEPPTPQD